MNVNPISFNPKAIAITAIVAFGGLAAFSLPSATEYTPSTHALSQPTEYGVQSAKILSKNTGVAVIKVDDFRIQVSFDFEAHPDSYGVSGSEFTAIDITNLAIDNITDINGKSYNDFTDYNDHRNINLLLATFIENNNLVEAV